MKSFILDGHTGHVEGASADGCEILKTTKVSFGEGRTENQAFIVALMNLLGNSEHKIYVEHTETAKEEKHRELVDQIHETYVAKNHDYGDSFTKSFEKYGITAALVRMEDKWNRLNSLAGKEAMVKDESIRDTLLDLANYCLMTVMEMDK